MAKKYSSATAKKTAAPAKKAMPMDAMPMPMKKAMPKKNMPKKAH